MVSLLERVVQGLDLQLGFEGIPVLYTGEIRHKLLNSLADTVFALLMDAKLPPQVCRRVYSASVEMLQNVVIHGEKAPLGAKPRFALYAMDYDEERVQVLTANIIRSSDVPALRAKIDELNAPGMTIDRKRAKYQIQLNEGALSEKGGAGLGIIEVAKKTDIPIEYRFIPMQGDYAYFLMCASYM